jgi:copper chaperone CopZ
MGTTYKVAGMTCSGCVRAVTGAIKRVAPAASVEVDLAAGKITVDPAIAEADISRAVEDAGFEFARRG